MTSLLTSLRLEVLTPQSTVVDAPVASVTVPLTDGWLGILPGHAEFQARLLPGEVIFQTVDSQGVDFQAKGRRRVLAQLGGTVVVEGSRVTVLVGVAALDRDLAALEQSISEEAEQLAAMEEEAEKHFDRVYRQMAQTLSHRRGSRT